MAAKRRILAKSKKPVQAAPAIFIAAWMAAGAMIQAAETEIIRHCGGQSADCPSQ